MLGTHTTSNEQRVQAQPSVELFVPKFQFSVLTCAYGRATKTVYKDGRVITPRPVGEFYYKYCEIESLEDFAKLVLTWLFDEPTRFIIRGQLLPGLTGKQLRRFLSRPKEPATIECPARSWIVLDLDGVEVPNGLDAPDKLAEAAYHIRDHMLPSYFRGVRCVAVATAKTGRIPGRVWMRMYFLLSCEVDNYVLHNWADALWSAHPDLALDPSVMHPIQPIYTARPIFKGGMVDPVPVWGRVRVLDGHEEYLTLDLTSVRKSKARGERPKIVRVVCDDMPPWMVEEAEADVAAGLGIWAAEETSAYAWKRIRAILDKFALCRKGVRHKTLQHSSWELAALVAEGEMPEALAREVYERGAKRVEDDEFDSEEIQRIIDEAFDHV